RARSRRRPPFLRRPMPPGPPTRGLGYLPRAVVLARTPAGRVLTAPAAAGRPRRPPRPNRPRPCASRRSHRAHRPHRPHSRSRDPAEAPPRPRPAPRVAAIPPRPSSVGSLWSTPLPACAPPRPRWRVCPTWRSPGPRRDPPRSPTVRRPSSPGCFATPRRFAAPSCWERFSVVLGENDRSKAAVAEPSRSGFVPCEGHICREQGWFYP
ncbi:MAG: hypothetical protein RL354_729, partial [Planctomycetota bacterium]